jgi:rubrerythrin
MNEITCPVCKAEYTENCFVRVISGRRLKTNKYGEYLYDSETSENIVEAVELQFDPPRIEHTVYTCPDCGVLFMAKKGNAKE